MKLLLLGKGAVGLAITQYLLTEYPDDLALVVTTDRDAIFRAAQEAGVPARVYESDKSLLANIPSGLDLGVLAWWPKILKKPLIDVPKNGFVNTHPSLLPYNRGKNYKFWAIVERNPFGVSLHRVNSGIDTGEVIAQKEIDYDWTDSGETLYEKAQEKMVALFRQTYPALRTGVFESRPQVLGEGSFHAASELDAASCIELDSEYTARSLLDRLRARTFEGHPGCWFEDGGTRYEISVRIRKVENE